MSRTFSAVFLALAFIVSDRAHAADLLTTSSVRAFVATQNRAWNARDFDFFYASFRPDAQIVTITKTKDGKLTKEARSLVEDRCEAMRYFGRAALKRAVIAETNRVESVVIAVDGRHATVRVREETRVTEHRVVKVLHATTEQELEIESGRIVSVGLTQYNGP